WKRPSAPPSAPDERSFTVSRAKALVVLVPAALALFAGVAVASSTSVTITTPKEGQSFSKKKVPQLPVTGDVTFAAANANTSLYVSCSCRRFLGAYGAPFPNLPSHTAGVDRAVLLSLEYPTCASTTPVAFNANGNGSSVAIPSPAFGKHPLYAQSVQRYATSAV